MQINGKPLNLLYTIYAELKIQELMMVHDAKTLGDLFKKRYMETLIDVAVIMSEAYARKYGATAITLDEILNAPADELAGFDNAVGQAIKEGEYRTVESENPKPKKAKKSTGQSS